MNPLMIQAIITLLAEAVKAGTSIASILKAVEPLVPAEKRLEIANAILAAEQGWRDAPNPPTLAAPT